LQTLHAQALAMLEQERPARFGGKARSSRCACRRQEAVLRYAPEAAGAHRMAHREAAELYKVALDHAEHAALRNGPTAGGARMNAT
jgi:hypothetical protein